MNKKIFILGLLFFLVPCISNAAELTLLNQSTNLIPKEQFEVSVLVNSQTDTLNTFSGDIQFPSQTVALQSIRDGDSIIGFWIEKPKELPTTAFVHSVRFSGTIPGGFKGQGKLFSLIFSVLKTSDQAQINATNLVSLKNDGYGTKVITTSNPLTLSIKDTQNTPPPIQDEIHNTTTLVDTTPPQNIKTQVIRDTNLYNNNWAIIFDAKDSESGIDHYEIQESDSAKPRNEGWANITSPYQLQNQDRTGYIHIKAVNRVGLSTITTIPPQQKTESTKIISTSQMAKILLVLLFIFFLLLYMIRKRGVKKQNNVISQPNNQTNSHI